MLSQELLPELVSVEAQDRQVLSLYVDTDCAQDSMETIKLRVRGMLKELEPEFAPDAAAIERYLDHEFDWTRPGLAIFSAMDRDFFRPVPIAVPFRNRLRLGMRFYIKPLAHFLDYYAHYGVILIDKLGARFFEYHLGELQAQDGFMGEEVQKLKRGSGSSAVGMRGGQGGGRHENEVMQRNLRDAAAAANIFFGHHNIRRLFLGGTEETVAQFREALPKQLLSCVADTFTIEMTAGEHEVRQRTLALLIEANAEREKRLVDELIALEARGANATLGLDDTLKAISEKRVQVLVLSDGYRAPGYVHEESGYVVANLARSPVGDREMTRLDDVLDLAATLTVAQGGRIEIVSNNAALERAGQIGALLRY